MAQVKPANKKKMNKNVLIASVIAIVILVAFAVSLLSSSGLFVRVQKGASTDNFTVNGAMMEYFANSTYQSWYQNNYYYLLLGYLDFDPSTPLDEQYVDSTKTQTYADYFAEVTKTNVSQYLKLCEAAKADPEINFAEYEAEAKAYADEQIKLVKEAAKEAGTDYTSYLHQYFGASVSQSDLKKALIIEHIASDYGTFAYNRVNDAITEEREDKYLKDNLASFISADYLYLTFTGVAPEKVDETKYEGGKDSQEYKDAVAKAEADAKAANELQIIAHKEIADKLSAATTAEEFKKIILDYKYAESFKSAYDTAVKDLKDEEKPNEETLKAFEESIKQAVIDAVLAGKSDILSEETETADETLDLEETAWEKASKTLPASVITKLNSVLTAATNTTFYGLDSDLKKYLFAGVKAEYGLEYAEGEEQGENAKAGTHTIEKEMTDAEKAYANYSFSVYFVTEPAHNDETILRDVGHILFKIDSSKDTDPAVSYKTSEEAKAAAEKLLAEIQAAAVDGVVSKEVFEGFAKNTHDSSVFYEDVNKGDMVEEFDEWLFAAEKVGEVGLVYGETSSYKGWHIIYYGGETGEPAWRLTAHQGAANDDTNTWFEELEIEVYLNDEIIRGFFK